jgi:hypothetical protein
MGVHLMGMHLMGVHLMGMHLIGIHFMGMTTWEYSLAPPTPRVAFSRNIYALNFRWSGGFAPKLFGNLIPKL